MLTNSRSVLPMTRPDLLRSTRGDPQRIVVMGVAGCGKTTVAQGLATQFGARFLEADDFHLPSSIRKMSEGVALDDDDRWPWLLRLQLELANSLPVVMACSALKKSYRELLRRAGDVRFVFLDVDAAAARSRMALRSGHFMAPSMIDSQFAALERPGLDESDVSTVSGSGDVDTVVRAALEAIAAGVPPSARASLVHRTGVQAEHVPIPRIVERCAEGGSFVRDREQADSGTSEGRP